MLVDKIIAHESGELDLRETFELFSELVKSGQAWRLQGSYGRSAKGMIEAGFLSPSGDITALGYEKIKSTEWYEGVEEHELA